MPIEQPATPKPKLRWFHPTPGRLLIVLLAMEGVLLLSEWSQWFAFNEKKGWTVLVAVAALGVFLLVMLLWYVTSLIFHWRFQFSIRSLLVLTIAVAIPASWLAVELKKNHEQRKAVEGILQTGGRVWYQYDQPWAPFWVCATRNSAKVPLGPSWLRRWLGDDFFREVVQVNFEHRLSFIADKELERAVPLMAKLPSLETVYLSETMVTGNELVHLKELTKVTHLLVEPGRWSLSDKDLEQICQIKSLETLKLGDTRITDDGLSQLRNLPNLRCLYLFTYGDTVTPKGLPILISLPNLREVILYNANMTKADIKKSLGGRSNLKIDLYFSIEGLENQNNNERN